MYLSLSLKHGRMAKFYSLSFVLTFIIVITANAQNVGIGTSNPQEKLHVEGGIKIGFTTGTLAGSIRFNPATQSFEGRDSTNWAPLGGGGGQDNDWTVDGLNMYPDSSVTGNVGIGTVVPLTKLHVVATGTAVRAQGGNSTVPAIDAISLTGNALKAVTSADSIAAIYTYSEKGTALRAYSSSGALPAIWSVSDSSTAVAAKTNSGTFSALEVTNMDSAGYAMKVVNNEAIDQEGGNAAWFIGDLSLDGALRNTDSTLYGGSVAVNDGMTVGNIAGSSCIPNIQISESYDSTFNYALIFGSGGATWNHYPPMNTGGDSACRSITNFHFEVTIADQEGFELDFTARVRGEFIGSMYQPNANLNLVTPFPSYYPTGALDTFYYNSGNDFYISRWAWDQHYWDGQDPSGTNWYVKLEEHAGDGEYLLGYTGRVDYKWADSTESPTYAAFGEIRASGPIYANSNQLLGDLAEFFTVSSKIRKPEPGDLVAISKDDPQTFELTTSAYQSLLVGAISENPSVFLNTPEAGDPVALTGRVKVKVNMEGGKIVPGDPITSSSSQGIGMKANSDGMVLGYALEAFDGARTEDGKIWIILARGHMEKVNPANVKQIESSEVRGMQIAGSVKVLTEENSVFVPWDIEMKDRIPADVEFNDLFVELTPYGGNAQMFVKEVNADGIIIEIAEKTNSFKGFYYSTEIMTAIPEATDNAKPVVKEFSSQQERLSYAKELYKSRSEVLSAMQKRSGKSLKAIESMNYRQGKLYKANILEVWKSKTPELYTEWVDLGKELSSVIGNDQTFLRELRGN